MAQAQTTFRDYYGPGATRITSLLDYDSEEAPQGLLYRFGTRIVRANNEAVGAITGLPDQLRDNWRLVRDPLQLRLLARALVDDGLLTARRRKAIFSILLWGTLLTWAVAAVVLYFSAPDALITYQSAWSLFFYSLATSLFLPTPFEFLLTRAAQSLGVFWTVAIAATAKVAGAYIVLLMGDKVNEGLDAMMKRRSTRALFERTMAFAHKYGYFAIFIIFAIPFMSDTIPLFLLAVMRMAKLPFLGVVFVAIVVRSLLYLYAGSFFTELF